MHVLAAIAPTLIAVIAPPSVAIALAAAVALPALAATEEGAVLLDGREVPGKLLEIREGAVRIEGQPDAIPLDELGALAIAAPAGSGRPAAGPGPVVVFRDGEQLSGRVLKAASGLLDVQARSLALAVPAEALKGFRLREPAADDIFERDLSGPAPPRDTVYVRRGEGLLRVEGVFRALDDEHLALEYEGQERRIRRPLVLGVLFAPVASRRADEGHPAVLELRGGGLAPVFLAGLRRGASGPEVLFRFRGAPAGTALQAAGAGDVERVRFSSDRVLFLSAAEPVLVEEVPALGSRAAFPWRKDLAAGGGPIRLAGRVYRRGLGVHSRCALEYDLGAKYRTFFAVAGLDDGAGSEAAVTFRVAADGKELYRKDLMRGAAPEDVLLPVEGVARLRLEVDYGADGLDIGDHADWADARVTR
ncbi:MAG: NPCBM/NEW2 domain-containing protein [Planctomycetes bacterium]|nr:NPCBM/NEW2 domain-containing protein [Planctomycetota bacterium]